MFPDQLVDSCLFGQWGVERVCAGLFERDTYRHRNMILFNLSNLPAPTITRQQNLSTGPFLHPEIFYYHIPSELNAFPISSPIPHPPPSPPAPLTLYCHYLSPPSPFTLPALSTTLPKLLATSKNPLSLSSSPTHAIHS